MARLAFRSIGFFYIAQPSSYDVERTPDNPSWSFCPFFLKFSKFSNSVIIFLRTTEQNLTKLGRNYVWKDLYKQYTFRYGWLNKMATRDYLNSWLADFQKSCSLKPQDQIFWNFIGLFTAMTFTNDPLFVPFRWLLGRLRTLKVVETLSENTFWPIFLQIHGQ